MTRSSLVLLAAIVACGSASRSSAQPDPKSGNATATALWFAHHFGAPGALTLGKDRELKARLIAAVGKSPRLSAEAAGDLFDKDSFRALAGGGDAIPMATMEKLLREKTPRSRTDLNPKTRLHADLLTTQFDMIGEEHRKPAGQLVDWVAKNYRPGTPLAVICVCTGNTRRSALSAAMGNVAASYYGLTDLRFFSGGTDPDAINPRTVVSLQEIGLDIEPTGEEAARGKADTANPIYRVRWGKGLEAREFSKKYADAANPKDGFAALVVCGEADQSCPTVAGAGVRIPVPYLDPKAFDGHPFEAAKYAERRDDIGRFLLSVAMQARRRLEVDGKLK